MKFEAEGREFAKFLRSVAQFIQTVKGQNNLWNAGKVRKKIVFVNIFEKKKILFD